MTNLTLLYTWRIGGVRCATLHQYRPGRFYRDSLTLLSSDSGRKQVGHINFYIAPEPINLKLNGVKSTMSNKQPVNKAKKQTVEIIKADDLKALNEVAMGMYQGKQKYVTMLYAVMLASPATISAHANYLSDMDEKQGGGRSGALLKTLRANLRYLATAHNLKAIPTVKALEKDGPLTLTKADPKPRKSGGAVAGAGVSGDLTLQDICASITAICKGMKPETRAKVADMVYDAAMGETESHEEPDTDSQE